MEVKVGNTPLVELKKIKEHLNLPFNVFAKVEGYNPTGSIKDRAVYQMLIDDYECGRINKETTIIEATSGNTGIALAYFSKVFGNKIIIVMPDSMSEERRKMIQSYGAILDLVKGGMSEANDRAIFLQKTLQNSIILGQFEHKSNPKAHYLYTAKEIVKALPTCKYIFAGIGSGGTITGIGKYIKDNCLDIKVIGIEPSESPLISKGVFAPHGIQGIGANFIPSNLDLNVCDDVVCVPTDESINTAKMINEIENLYVGYSSGAALLAALNYCKEHNIKDDICVVFPDKGDRYLWK